jgi:hypothetical protein
MAGLHGSFVYTCYEDQGRNAKNNSLQGTTLGHQNIKGNISLLTVFNDNN